tara:strand:+ start:361 stop:981 length:621 start_codon:yes stop_codon:yes gene_type:complete
MSENNSIAVIDKKTVNNARDILKGVTEQHTEVSSIETPKAYVYKKMGFDYVKLNYMRAIADKHFPGWSWTIQKTEVLGSEAYVVHGRLRWFDNGVWRKGDMVAAHRIQKKQGTSEFVDIGNDVKAANTDTLKKAFNTYLNIADDVYRNQYEDADLTEEQRAKIIKIAEKIDNNMVKDIISKINIGEIHGLNYKAAIAKLERLAGGK